MQPCSSRPLCLSRRLFLVTFLLAAVVPGRAQGPDSEAVHYLLEIREPASHLIDVTMTLKEATGGTTIQFPAWYGTYQIRDFVQHVRSLRATCGTESRRLDQLDKQTWRVEGGDCAELSLRYRFYADGDGVFSSGVDRERGFLNLAMILFSLSGQRSRPATVKFNLPPGWKAAMPLEESEGNEFPASSYIELVDSPVELGKFSEYSYRQKGALYRLIVANGGDGVSRRGLLDLVGKITDYETSLMEDVPFSTYTFFFHFWRRGGGGMEHRNSSAMRLASGSLSTNREGAASLIAHEFFHLWNAKRIAPRALNPPDYSKECYTDALWFTEGLSSTYANYTLVRTGLISSSRFYRRLAQTIEEYEARPAVRYQSLRDSSLSTWLDKYPEYRLPRRSVSYYAKGQVVGHLLDLAIRDATGNRRSLDDVMRALNREFGKTGRGFDETSELRRVIEQVAGTTFEDFFERYVSGVDPLPYDELLGKAGLRMERSATQAGDLGFVAVRNFDGPYVVAEVTRGSPAWKAGLRGGEEAVALNGSPYENWRRRELRTLRQRQNVRLRVRRGGRIRVLQFTLKPVERTLYSIKEIENPAPEQLALRQGLLEGTTSSSAGP